MRLLNARVTKYRSIDDSSAAEIDPDVTALVGKNESGKTSFLRALYILKPIEADKFDVDIDFPRKDRAAYKDQHDKNPLTVVTAEFTMEDPDVGAFKEEFGPETLKDNVYEVSKNYANRVTTTVDVDEAAAVRHFLTQVKLESEAARQEALKLATGLDEAVAALSKHSDPAVKALSAQLTKRFPKPVAQVVSDWIFKRTPAFVYFSDYQLMPGTASIPYLMQRKAQKQLNVGETTLLRLIARAGLTLDELRDERKFERQVANLEAAAIAITKEVFKYWTQNKNLKVKFLTSGPEPDDGRLREGPLIRVRIENTKHGVTVPFDERSRGFVWFFSFLAYFNDLERNADTDLILLLDEPGLSLHATAQGDLLGFIEERLAPVCQVVYTTHSPFMVDAKRLNRVRTVQDMEDVGTVVSSDVFKNDQATIFPLQAALGFEITQTLFIGPNSLLVEGPSEVLYLPNLSEQLVANKKTPLDPRWTLTPIGGIDKSPSFVSLFGAQKLNIAVLMDHANHQKKLVESLVKSLRPGSVIPLHEFRSGKESDIEDLFDIDDYLGMVNETYRRQLRKPIEEADLTHSSDRIVKRLEHFFESNNVNGGKFSHGAVADYYARNTQDFKSFNEVTLSRFETVFRKANSLLPGARPETVPKTVARK